MGTARPSAAAPPCFSRVRGLRASFIMEAIANAPRTAPPFGLNIMAHPAASPTSSASRQSLLRSVSSDAPAARIAKNAWNDSS